MSKNLFEVVFQSERFVAERVAEVLRAPLQDSRLNTLIEPDIKSGKGNTSMVAKNDAWNMPRSRWQSKGVRTAVSMMKN